MGCINDSLLLLSSAVLSSDPNKLVIRSSACEPNKLVIHPSSCEPNKPFLGIYGHGVEPEYSIAFR
jgi:hypothetical protein